MRNEPSDLYEILGVQPSASSSEIKSAFKKEAMRSHPDRNGNTAEATARFRLVYHAFTVLSSNHDRLTYDRYLKNSSVFRRNRRVNGFLPGTVTGLDSVSSLLNYILWDIEDFLSGGLLRSKAEASLIKVLAFIEAWILEPAGFPDFFYQSRRITRPKGSSPIFSSEGDGHRPFVNLKDYFFSIRRRTDEFLKSLTPATLVEPVPGTERIVLDCIFEAHRLGTFCLGEAREAEQERTDSIRKYRPSHRSFEDPPPDGR